MNKSHFRGIKVFCLFILAILMLFPLNAQAKEQINRGEFIKVFAQSQPGNPFLPKNHLQMKDQELYSKTVQLLNQRGIKVLNGKKPNEPLTNLEFVRVAYAFTGEPLGKSLFQQKLYLKKKGLLASADVGLTTGLRGDAFQFHKGSQAGFKAKLANPVFMYDKIETEDASNIAFTFDDKSTLTLGEDAVVRITKHVYNPDTGLRQTVVNITSGMVRFVVMKARSQGSQFKVITPTATAAVLGTEFVVNVKADGQTEFVGIENRIETRPILANGQEGIAAIVGAGEIRSVTKDRIASEVGRVSAAMITTIRAQTSTPQTISSDPGVSTRQAQSVANNPAITTAALQNIQVSDQESVERTASTVKKSAQKVTDKAQDDTSKATESLNNTANGATASVSNTVNAVSGKLNRALDGVSGDVDQTVSNVTGNLSDTTGALKGTVGNIAGGDAVQSAIQGTAKSAALSTAKATAQNTAQSIAQQAAQSMAQEVAKSAAESVAKSASRDIVQSAMQDEVKAAAQSVAQVSARQAAQETALSVAQQTVREIVVSIAQDEARNTAISVGQSSVRDSVIASSGQSVAINAAGEAINAAGEVVSGTQIAASSASDATSSASSAASSAASDAASSASDAASSASSAASSAASDAASSASEAASSASDAASDATGGLGL